ncbi:MAG: hypothetical protein SCJ97_07450 [Bacillota bacterium]|nr:hypothetical protein [Bacillota bacterium]
MHTKSLIARTADFIIAIGGEYGTLSEIALALKLFLIILQIFFHSFTIFVFFISFKI